MKKNLQLKLFVAVAAFVASLPMPAVATGFRLPDQDAFATARGEAFVATADNASAIYYNPAGLSQLEGQSVRAGIYGLNLDVTHNAPTGGHFKDGKDLFAIPQVFYSYSPEKSRATFGLGIYSPYGLSSKWPDDSGFRTVGTSADLKYFTFNPVIAYKLTPTLFVGAGVSANYANIKLRQGLFWPTQPYDGFRFQGDGWGFGYNAGLMWKAADELSFGFNFRSSTKINLSGSTYAHNDVFLPNPAFPGGGLPTFENTSAANGDFYFPLNFVTGVSYRPTPKWNLEFNAEYTDWNYLKTVTINQATPLPGLLPAQIPIAFNWQSSWYFEFGGTHYFDNGWTVSAGYIFNQNSVPDATYQPLVFDLDRHFLSLGAGHQGKRFGFDVAYQFGYGPTRTVSGSAYSAGGQNADGEYKFISHALFVTAAWKF